MAVGIRKTKNGWGDQGSVLVRYPDGTEMDIPEDRYRLEGYQPPYEDLPWADGDANA